MAIRIDRAAWRFETVLVLAALPIIGSLLYTNGEAERQLVVFLYCSAVVASWCSPSFCVGAVAVTLLYPLTLGADSEPYGIDVRFTVTPLILAAAMRALWVAWRERSPSAPEAGAPHDDGDSPGSRVATTLRYALPAMAIFGLLSFAWSVRPGQTLASTLALGAAAALCFAVSRLLSMDQLVRILAVLGWCAIAMSVLMLVVAPGPAMLAGRFRGVFGNPNGLGAFLVVATPILLVGLKRLRWPAAALLLGLCAITASRAGFGAMVLECTVFLMAGGTAKVRLATTAAAAAVGGWLAVGALNEATATKSDLLLLRTNNSRANEWVTSLRYFHEHPWLGVGLGALPVNPAGLLPQVLSACGLVGAAIAGFFILVLLAGTIRGAPMYTALVAGSLVNVIFEPWLFTAGSFYCVAFWVVVSHREALEYGATRARSPRRPSAQAPGGPTLSADRDGLVLNGSKRRSLQPVR